MPYEERFTLSQPWDVVFAALQACCDRMSTAVLVSADEAKGRVVVVIRTRALNVGGAVLIVDVGVAPDGGSRVRIGAMSAFAYDVRLALRFHASRYRRSLLVELASPDVYSAPERRLS